MGRPIYRDVAGDDVRGPYVGANIGIKVVAYFDNALHDCYIVNQKGGRSYLVQDIMSGERAKCKLVETMVNTNNTMTIVGFLASAVPAGNLDPEGSGITLSKLQKRTAIDWSENRYTWTLVSDSSMDYIELTPFS